MNHSRYSVADELTGPDVQFNPDQDILIKLAADGDLPTIYIDGTSVDNPLIQRVIDAITGLRF